MKWANLVIDATAAALPTRNPWLMPITATTKMLPQPPQHTIAFFSNQSDAVCEGSLLALCSTSVVVMAALLAASRPRVLTYMGVILPSRGSQLRNGVPLVGFASPPRTTI